MRLFFFLFSLVLVLPSLQAQEKEILRSNQQWFSYANQTTLNEKWGFLADVGYRWKDAFSQASQYIGRIGMAYQLNANMRAIAGFAHLGFYDSAILGKVEFRPYQDWIIRHSYGKLGTTHRFRAEQRIFYTVVDGTITDERNFYHRLRYRFSLRMPLFSSSEKDCRRKLFLAVSDEILINAGKRVVYNVFDQHRFLISPILQWNQSFSVRLTYFNLFAGTSQPATYKAVHIFLLGLSQKLSLENK